MAEVRKTMKHSKLKEGVTISHVTFDVDEATRPWNEPLWLYQEIGGHLGVECSFCFHVWSIHPDSMLWDEIRGCSRLGMPVTVTPMSKTAAKWLRIYEDAYSSSLPRGIIQYPMDPDVNGESVTNDAGGGGKWGESSHPYKGVHVSSITFDVNEESVSKAASGWAGELILGRYTKRFTGDCDVAFRIWSIHHDSLLWEAIQFLAQRQTVMHPSVSLVAMTARAADAVRQFIETSKEYGLPLPTVRYSRGGEQA